MVIIAITTLVREKKKGKKRKRNRRITVRNTGRGRRIQGQG